jgi:GxxExxY protein
MFQRLSDKEESIAKQAVNIAYNIHKQLGPGLLESVYEKCFCYELSKSNVLFEKQKEVPIIYDELKIENGLRLDILVEDLLIIELKAQETFHPSGRRSFLAI